MTISEGRDGKCEGRNEKCEFLARESVNTSPFVWTFGKGKCKLIANFSATMVTSLPSVSVSLSLSLSPKVPHAQYRKRFRASYNILGDSETREESIGKRRRSWTVLDLTGFRLMRRVAHGRSRSLACRESRRKSPSETPEAQHRCAIAFALLQWHVAFSGGSSFFTNWAGLFFLLRFFPFFSLSFSLFFFFFGTRLLTLRNLRYVATRLIWCLFF